MHRELLGRVCARAGIDGDSLFMNGTPPLRQPIGQVPGCSNKVTNEGPGHNSQGKSMVISTGLGPRSLLPTFPCVSRPPSLLRQDAFGRQGRHGYELWTGLGPRSFPLLSYLSLFPLLLLLLFSFFFFLSHSCVGLLHCADLGGQACSGPIAKLW